MAVRRERHGEEPSSCLLGEGFIENAAREIAGLLPDDKIAAKTILRRVGRIVDAAPARPAPATRSQGRHPWARSFLRLIVVR